VAIDSSGNVFIVAPDYNIVLRLDAKSGQLTIVAGNGTAGFSGDSGPATNAELYCPTGVAVDSAGNLYIADYRNNRIRKVSGGVIATVAGNGTWWGSSGDNGPAASAELDGPIGVAVDSAGNLYIADSGNDRIRKVSGGVIATVAGKGTFGYSGDNGPATSAELYNPCGVAVDSSGNLYIADYSNNRIRKVSGGVITTVAGNGTAGHSGDNGAPASAELYHPRGVAVDSAGNLYIADSDNSRIRRVSSGVITTVAGNGTWGYSGDNGPATTAELSYPTGVAVDSAGNLYIADLSNNRIRKVSSGAIATIAGNGTGFGGDNGAPTSAQLDQPGSVAVDSTGNLYIADTDNNRIRKVSGGKIATVAGNGTAGSGGDNGSSTSAELYSPQGVAVDSSGNLYIADSGNNRIRKVSGGKITTVAGNGTAGSSGDNGSPTSAKLNYPVAVAVDAAGNLYIADTGNNRIRKVPNGGVITTVAGNGTAGSSGDNGSATSAELDYPVAVAADSAGNLYIADMNNNRIREVSGGVITTVAGNGTEGYSGDNGPAASAELDGPVDVAVDSAGNLYIADSGNSLVRRVSGGVIATIAGGGATLGDNGPATSAAVFPGAVALGALGNIYVADYSNDRVRVLAPSGPSCTYTVSPLSFPATVPSSANLIASVQTASGCAWAVQGLPAWIVFSGNAVNSGPGPVTLVTLINIGAARSATVSIAGFSVVVSQAGAPALTSGTVANGATYIAGGLVPGSWAQVKGTNLSGVTRIWAASDFTGLGSNLPTNLSGVQVYVNNLPAAVYYISPTQVDFQVPDGISGTASVQVVNNGVESDSVTAAAVSSSPGIFPVILNGTNYAACVFWLDGLIAGNPSSGPAFRNAKPGEIVQLYATGLVSTPAGVPISPQTVSGVTVTIGSIKVTADYAGLVAVGEFQINFTVPTLAAGNYPITIQVNGVSSPATINSSPAAQIVLPIQP
jgi:uncharacterized protein (TIGR03437 family)